MPVNIGENTSHKSGVNGLRSAHKPNFATGHGISMFAAPAAGAGQFRPSGARSATIGGRAPRR
jgi:hypothetical protein